MNIETGRIVGVQPASVITVASYFEAFSSTHSWADLCAWPPDVFAFTNLLLDHTEAYRFVVSPPRGSYWPPTPDWESLVIEAAEEWRDLAGCAGESTPEAVAAFWAVVLDHLDTPLSALRSGSEHDLCEALLSLHAMSDEACRGLAWPAESSSGAFERRAWDLLAEHGSLASIDSTRVRITPKSHSASRGITIRSLSRYLALSYESIEVHWRHVEPLHPIGPNRRDFNMVLAPWPLDIDSKAFQEVEGPLQNMDPRAFGFFRFDPDTPLDLGSLRRIIEAAKAEVTRVDSLILPEGAVEATEVAAVEDLMVDLGVLSLVIGVREAAAGGSLGRNYVQVSIRTERGWESYQQPKHHRWCLDESQIRQYHLGRALKPSKQWWEAIELPARTQEIIDLGGGGITAPLVCEDLARMDEVADLLRRIGPTLVLALLLDGPQLPQRWPCRYASVLADEPGSAVLTLSSFGMVKRSCPPGKKRSRVVALWSDPSSGLRQIELGKGCQGVLITASAELKTAWTADGRRHERNTPAITLADVKQLRVQTTASAQVREQAEWESTHLVHG